MTRRTIKDLDEEFSVVKAELTDIKTKMAELLRLCNNIQKSFNSDKATFKCNVCDEEFDSSIDQTRKPYSVLDVNGISMKNGS